MNIIKKGKFDPQTDKWSQFIYIGWVKKSKIVYFSVLGIFTFLYLGTAVFISLLSAIHFNGMCERCKLKGEIEERPSTISATFKTPLLQENNQRLSYDSKDMVLNQ